MSRLASGSRFGTWGSGLGLALVLGSVGPACTEKAPPAAAKPAAQPAPPAPSGSELGVPGGVVAAPQAGEMERVEIAPAKPPTIELVNAGGADKRSLRLDPQVGAKTKMEMVMTMSIGMKLGARDMPAVKTPPIRAPGVVEVLSKDAEKIRARMDLGGMELMDDPNADPRVVTALRAQMVGFGGMASETVMSPRGAILSGHFDIPKSAPANIQQTMRGMGQSMGQMAVPMPEEQVGVGAVWIAKSTIENQGMKLLQTATYTLDGFDGDYTMLSVSLVQEAAPGPFTPPGLPPGATVEILEIDSKGSGKVRVSMTEALPQSTEMNLDSHMKMRVKAGPEEQTMAMDMELGVKFGIVE